MSDKTVPVPAQGILAWWLYKHPDQEIILGDTFYKYDSGFGWMMYKKPVNRVRKYWMRAKGLEQWLQYLQKNFPEVCHD